MPPDAPSIGEGQLFWLFRLAGIQEAPRVGLRHAGSAHGLEGAIHSARFTPIFSPAALKLLLVSPLLAGIELIHEIAFAFPDHGLSQRDIAAGRVGARLEGLHRFFARNSFLNRRFDGDRKSVV